MKAGHSADKLLTKHDSAPVRGPWPIDLAHTRAFRLGDVEVQPATREAIRGGRRMTLDPKIMEVLVVLAAAEGAILSREDLITACWGGRAVTDDAINRVISRLRAVSRDIGGFEIETITKVGYRLIETDDGKAVAGPAINGGIGKEARPGLNRRALVAGAVGAAGLTAGALLWRQPWRHRPPPEAVDNFRRGEIAQRQGFSGQERQAISFYERAVQIDPLYSDAWGALALANTHLLEGYGEAEFAGVPDRLRSAARRSLELDPDNADAQLALILVKPVFRNWARMEAELRGLLRRHPRHWLLLGRLSVLLYDTGRLNEGIALHKQQQQIDPMLPVGDAYLANAMLSAGRLQEAEDLLDAARERWPAHPSLWSVTFRYLLYSGRPQAAGAFIMDPEVRPSGVRTEDVAPFVRLAQAVDSGRRADAEASIDEFAKRAHTDAHNIPSSASIFALLGRPDLTFAAWERYFFNRGPFGPSAPIQLYTRRYARELFSVPMAPLRSDQRFGHLLQSIGLEAYWRQTHSLPDYRRRA